jgi:hypothetical protein
LPEDADDDPFSVSHEGVDLTLPLGLGKIAEIHRGDIFLIAGESDSGKSVWMGTILSHLVREFVTLSHVHKYFNKEKEKERTKEKEKENEQSPRLMRYLCSEAMGELGKKLVKIGNGLRLTKDHYKHHIQFFERNNLFHQLIPLTLGILRCIDWLPNIDVDFRISIHDQEFVGNIQLLPTIPTGTIIAPLSIASLKPPGLNGWSFPSLERVPSGAIHKTIPFSITFLAYFMSFKALRGLYRSMETNPVSCIALPQTGIFSNSFFASIRMLPGSATTESGIS